MTETKTLFSYRVSEKNDGDTAVIIVAAGNSSRMEGTDKILARVAGIPVIVRTLRAFENSKTVSDIILVTKKESIFEMQTLCSKYGISKLTDIAEGGTTRRESVEKGMALLDGEIKKVLIHDGARPFVTEKIIKDVADGLNSFPAVVCAVPLKDTVKEVSPDGTVEKTPQRETLKAVQTPQGVRKDDYKAALEKTAEMTGLTDDASVMEAAGFTVKTVEGSYMNIKITTPEDLLIAEVFAKEDFK